MYKTFSSTFNHQALTAPHCLSSNLQRMMRSPLHVTQGSYCGLLPYALAYLLLWRILFPYRKNIKGKGNMATVRKASSDEAH